MKFKMKMIWLIPAVFALTLFVPEQRAMAQTPAEIKAAAKTLREAGERFLKLIENVTEEQWNFKADALRHTIGEEAEHVALAEHDLYAVILKALQSPQNPLAARELAGKEKKVRELMLNPGRLAERYKPPNRLKTKAEVVEYFTRAHRTALKTLEGTPDLSLYIYKHPHRDYRDLTAYQWFYYIAYHNMRHCEQIELVMSQPDFPGGPKKGSD